MCRAVDPHHSEGPAADFSRSVVASPVPREAHVRPSPALAASTRRRILPCCRPVAKVHRLVFECAGPPSVLPSDLPAIGKSHCASPPAHDLLCEQSVAAVRLYQHRPKISACPTPRVFTETRTDGKTKTILRTSAAGRPAGHAHRPASRKDGAFSTCAQRQMNEANRCAWLGALRARRSQTLGAPS